VKILVMGATGYIGGRLVPSLIEVGHDVRCLTRDPGRLRDVVWAPRAEIVAGDALDQSSLEAAMEGVATVYYLVHSIGTGSGFAESDRNGCREHGAGGGRRRGGPDHLPRRVGAAGRASLSSPRIASRGW
jgi:uncharacterized protein YbjT (DUF2867 family)